MKIKCPSCTTTGRVPDGKIPATGANIRCPACSFVFFVGGPEATNVVTESEPTPDASPPEVVANVTSSLPSDIVARVRAAAHEAIAAQRNNGDPHDASGGETAPRAAAPSPPTKERQNDAAADSSLSARAAQRTPQSTRVATSSASPSTVPAPDAGGFSGYGTAPTAPDSPAVPTSPIGRPAASTPQVSDSAASAMGVMLGGGAGGRPRVPTGWVRTIAEPAALTEPAVSSPSVTPKAAETPQAEDQNASSTVPGLSGAPRSKRTGAFKVRNSLGITYDFPDVANVRRWLEGRGSHDDLSVSNDGGSTWHAPAALAEVGDVRPSGLRSTQSTESIRAIRQTGSVRTFGSTGAVPSVGDAPARPDGIVAPTPESGLFSLAGASAATAPVPVPAPAPASATSAADAASSLTERMASAARGVHASRRETAAEPAAKDGDRADEKQKRTRRLKILSAVAAAVAVLAVAGQVFVTQQDPGLQIPDSPAGRQAVWVLDTIQGGTETLSDATIQERFAPSVLEEVPLAALRQQLEFYDTWREAYRPIRFSRPPTATLLEITVLTNGGDTGVIRVETEATAPHRVVGLNFRGVD